MSSRNSDTDDVPEVSSSDFLKFTEYYPPDQADNDAPVASTSRSAPDSSANAVASTSSASVVDEDCRYLGEDFVVNANSACAGPSKPLIKMSTLSFSANISTMFTDLPFMERFKKAKECGFQSVEIHNPYEYTVKELVDARDGLKIDLVNSYNGNHEMGMAATPGSEEEFTNSWQHVMKYEFALGFKKLHIMSGMRLKDYTYEEQKDAFVQNLKNLVASDFLENRNMVGVIEPICPAVKEGYFLDDYKKAIEILNEVGSDQIKLLLDVYHLHKLQGHLFRYLPRYYKYAGHIQVSQEPGRGPPFADGEINYDEVFKYLQRRGHTDIIGLECISSGNPEDYAALVNGCW